MPSTQLPKEPASVSPCGIALWVVTTGLTGARRTVVMGGNARTGFWRFYSVVKEPLEARADPSVPDVDDAALPLISRILA